MSSLLCASLSINGTVMHCNMHMLYGDDGVINETFASMSLEQSQRL